MGLGFSHFTYESPLSFFLHPYTQRKEAFHLQVRAGKDEEDRQAPVSVSSAATLPLEFCIASPNHKTCLATATLCSSHDLFQLVTD